MKLRSIRILVVLFMLVCCSVSIAAGSEPTLKQKIGQMLMLGFPGEELNANDPIVHDILAQRIGGVILFTQNQKQKKASQKGNVRSPAQLKELTAELQDYTRQAAKNQGNQLYPLLIGIDYEGGKVNRLKPEMGFPQTVTAVQIASGSDAQAAARAQQMAKTLKAAGVNLDFAPVVDVNVNPRNPIIAKYDRSYSADPQRVAKYAGIFSQAMAAQGILCSYKHFPGHGSSTTDSHKGFVDITKTWKQYELTPYQKLLNTPNGCELVMVGHLINRQLDSADYPATLSKMIITGLLRNQLHFSGVVITDDLQMAAISQHYDVPTTVRLAINAGADILMFGNQLTKPQDAQALVDMIYNEVQKGNISQQRIDEAYQHVMQLKLRLQSAG